MGRAVIRVKCPRIIDDCPHCEAARTRSDNFKCAKCEGRLHAFCSLCVGDYLRNELAEHLNSVLLQQMSVALQRAVIALSNAGGLAFPPCVLEDGSLAIGIARGRRATARAIALLSDFVPVSDAIEQRGPRRWLRLGPACRLEYVGALKTLAEALDTTAERVAA
jgi:hypothetical protein